MGQIVIWFVLLLLVILIINNFWKQIKGLFYFGRARLSQCQEQNKLLGVVTGEDPLKSLTVTKGVMLSSETKCPLSHNNVVFSKSTCDHNGGVMDSSDGIKLTICKNAINKGKSVTFYIAVDLNGPFKFVAPSDCETDFNMSSPYYWIGVAGACHFQKHIKVEFEHFGACHSSHYRLLCCEDNDEPYTMRPVDYKLRFTVQDDGKSLCEFMIQKFCSFCLDHHHEDTNMHRVSALYLKPDPLGSLNNFSIEIWFTLVISHCLNKSKKSYEGRGLKLNDSYLFEAPSHKNSMYYFTLEYQQAANGWRISHDQSTEIKAKKNYYQGKTIAGAKANEENILFPPCFILDISNTEHICSSCLDIDFTITLYNNKERKNAIKSHTFKLVAKDCKSKGDILPSHIRDNNKPKYKELVEYSKNISSKWTDIATELGVDRVQIGIIECDYPRDVQRQCCEMLHHWLQKYPSACWCDFIEALRTADQNDIANKARGRLVKYLKNIDLLNLEKYLNFVPEDSLQCLVTYLLQHATVNLNSCGNRKEKIKLVSEAYFGEQNPSWTDLYRALKKAKCDNAASLIEATFLPIYNETNISVMLLP